MANRTLAIVHKVLNWHAARSDDFSSPVVRGMARASERRRDRILTDDELRAVWKTAAANPTPFALLVQFLLVTAARRTEALRLTWPEISPDGSLWTLPAIRNKTCQELARPLSAAAQDILAGIPRVVGCAFVFSGDGARALGGLSRRKREFDEACSVAGWTLHDLRRTARSLMARASVPSDHAERCLGHVIGGVRGIYDRHRYLDEMRQAFEALAAQINRIVDPVPNVVAMRAGS